MVMIDLITGFLGSGKTTFLKKYAEYLMDQGLHIGILENDFGAINVDMLMLHELRGDQCELEMIAGEPQKTFPHEADFHADVRLRQSTGGAVWNLRCR